jgi:hypothetical protein
VGTGLPEFLEESTAFPTNRLKSEEEKYVLGAADPGVLILEPLYLLMIAVEYGFVFT